MANAERVWQVIARIEAVEANPRGTDESGNSWDQGVWALGENGASLEHPLDLISSYGSVTACGTAMCAAGWAVISFPREALAACRRLEADGDSVTIENAAGYLLEFDSRQSMAFFGVSNHLADLVHLATEWCGPRPAPGDAVHQ